MRNEDVILYVPVRQCIVLRLREPSGRLSERRVQGPPGQTRGPGDSSRFLSIFLRPKECMSLKPVPDEVVLRQLRWRYATKKFDPTRKIVAEDWRSLEQALVHSPSSFGLQPWKFFVVTDPDLKAKLKTASWNQSQITDASHLVVFAIKITSGCPRSDTGRRMSSFTSPDDQSASARLERARGGL